MACGLCVGRVAFVHFPNVIRAGSPLLGWAAMAGDFTVDAVSIPASSCEIKGGGAKMRCRECAAETSAAAQFCMRCGAPVAWQPSVMADQAVGVVSDATSGAAPTTAAVSGAGAVSAAGQALPGPCVPGSGDKRETLPEASGAILAEWAESRTFSTTRLRPGYDEEEVDAFLEALRDTFLGIREPSLSSDEVRNRQFSTTGLRPGYDKEEVDAVLDEAAQRLAALQRCSTPAARQKSVAADLAADAIGDAPGGATPTATAASADGHAPPESYAPGRGDKIPAQLRRMRRGYSYLGLGALFGGWALLMIGNYFVENNEFDLWYFFSGLALWGCAAISFGLRIRLSRFLRRPADGSSAIVTACQRSGRTLVLYAPCDGCPSGLKVRLAWWAGPETLLPGESVTFCGRPSGVGLLLVSSPARGRAFVGTGRRRPASPAGEQAVPDASHQPGGQQAGQRYLQWGPLVLAGLALVVAVVATVISAVPQLTGHLTQGQLRAGDCLTGSNMGLGNASPWPYMVAAVPCTGPHLAEVFFSGNAWPQSLAYPGYNAVSNQGYARCLNAFSAYDGIDNAGSSFAIDDIIPSGGSDWASGDRQLVCVASQRGVPVDYSIKGSGR